MMYDISKGKDWTFTGFGFLSVYGVAQMRADGKLKS